MHTSERHIDVCLQKGTYTRWRLNLYKEYRSWPLLYLTTFNEEVTCHHSIWIIVQKMWCVISPCRLMNIWIYLHKACTKLLQLTVIGWTITLLSKMAGEGFLFFLFFPFFFLFHFFLKQYFFVSLFLFLTCICIVMTCWYIGTGCVFLLFVVVTGCLKMYRPIVPVGARVSGSRHLQNRWARPPGPGLEDFVILWMAANYWEGVIAGEGRVGVTLGF